MNPGIEAVQKLAHLGFRFRLEGETIKAKYQGPGQPDPAVVSPLLQVARQHKDDVRFFLKCHCAKCGCCCFIPDYEGRPLCLSCDWSALVELYPAMAGVKH